MIVQPENSIGDVIYDKATGERCIVDNIVYEANNFYFYTVILPSGEIIKIKPVNVFQSYEEYRAFKVINREE